jgi:hypothetical protein
MCFPCVWLRDYSRVSHVPSRPYNFKGQPRATIKWFYLNMLLLIKKPYLRNCSSHPIRNQTHPCIMLVSKKLRRIIGKWVPYSTTLSFTKLRLPIQGACPCELDRADKPTSGDEKPNQKSITRFALCHRCLRRRRRGGSAKTDHIVSGSRARVIHPWCCTLVSRRLVGEKFAILPLSILAVCYYAISCLWLMRPSVSMICGSNGILAKPTNDNDKIANGSLLVW